jgi:predicted phage terminase large subunit-like protein
MCFTREREPKSLLDKIRADVGEDIFAAQYQQCPSQPTGSMIKRASIQRCDCLPIRKESHYVVQSWDTASKVGANNDYSACVTLLVDDQSNYKETASPQVKAQWLTDLGPGDAATYPRSTRSSVKPVTNFYVADALRDRLLYPELKAQAISQAQKHKPDKILIEEAGLGRTLLRELKAAGLPAVGVIPEGDKSTRVSLQLEKFANGQVFFPEEAPWLSELENEVFAFPNGHNDDLVDALFQALAYKRPAFLWSDTALENMGKVINTLWLQQQIRGF